MRLGWAGLLLWPAFATAAPCDGVDRTTIAADRAAAPAIAKQLAVQAVAVRQVLKTADWTIVEVQPPDREAAFLFYHGALGQRPHVTLWAGAAHRGEQADIQAWALKNAPGIPPRLAACFAETVTHPR